MLSGIITLFMLLLFLVVVVWAWQPRNKKSFDAAARLAVEDDKGNAGIGDKRTDKKGSRE